MFINRTGPDPKPEKMEKPKYRKVTKKTIEKMDKKANVKQLIIDLDNVFSIFIRQRGMDDNGITKCFTCGKVDHWKSLQCGHYWGREEKSTRWDEENCQTQCYQCNCKKEGNKPAFTINLVKKYGPDILSKLEILKNRTMKVEPFILQLLIKEYKSKITQ